MTPTIKLLLAAALVVPGCYAQAEPAYAVSTSANLVEISPGLEVVADIDRPIFFADNLYWWFDGGIWYQSAWYGGGWRRAARVSPRLAVIGHPEHYAHFHPTARVAAHARVAGPRGSFRHARRR